MIEAIQQNFLQPIGLLGLLALIPLIIFYLVKPKPTEEVMPSMAFFTEKKKDGKVRNALRTLKRNKILLLHIFFVLLVAAALANPIISGLESDGDSVVILDASASVSDNRQEVQDFALNQLGESNTVITASADPEIQMRDASTERARTFVQNYDVKAEETDLASALQLASNYEGRVVLASDMIHTATSQDLKPLIDDLASDRTLKVMDINHENSHGFTDLNVEDGTAEVTIQNYVNRNRTLTLTKPGKNRKVSVGSLSTETIEVDLEPGTHELVLAPDEFAMDNNLYVSIPREESVQVSYLGEESPYFEEAVNLISFTNYNSGFEEDADIYYVSEEYSIGEDLKGKIEESGAAFIFEDRNGVSEYTPVQNYTSGSERQVEVSSGVTTIFTSTVSSYDITGEALASPDEALVLSKDDRALLYNVEDEKFGEKINYPLFWKEVLQRMSDIKTGDDLNLKTGIRKQFENPVTFEGEEVQGYTQIDQTGFYEGEQPYSANLLNSAEASPNINRISSRNDIGEEPGSDPARKYLIGLLAIIATLELTYLSRRGEV